MNDLIDAHLIKPGHFVELAPVLKKLAQSGLNLYGNILVSPTESDYYNSVNREIPLILDDILINDKGIVPFFAQIEEYIEQYPNLCVVIADTSGVKEEDDGEPVEANLTQNIKEYADKYKVKHNVTTIIYDIVTRK